jgi:death-on-curing protein
VLEDRPEAFLAVGLFLSSNGHRLVCSQADATLTMLAVASGSMDETGFAEWLRARVKKR